MSEPRLICDIADEISADWKKKNYAAVPYLQAMRHLGKVGDSFGYDTGKSIVSYFLCNAGKWRGETARRIKAELRGMLG